MINREEIGRNIKALLRGFADSKTDIEITVRSNKEADVYLDGRKFNTYLIDEKRFLHNIPKPMKRQEAFSISVIIVRDDLKEKFGMYEGAELQLPATVNEVKDAFQRARITDVSQKYSLLECQVYGKNILSRFADGSVDFERLNYLAKVMGNFTSHDHELFKGFMTSLSDEEFTIKNLINGAYNLDDCSIIDDLQNDEQLGRIYIDNGWIDWLTEVDKRVWKYLDYEKLGRDIRESDGGIYTEDGYFVNSKENYKEVYDGYRFPETFEDDEYIFKLQISRKPDGYESEEQSEGWLTLPASKEGKANFLRRIGAESFDECILIAIQSMEEHIPMCIKDLSQLGPLNSLAHRMKDMEKSGELAKFKAILSIANIQSVDDVILIANSISQYKLHHEPTSVIEYAKVKFSTEIKSKLPEDIVPHFNFATYGEALNNKGNLKVTEYGVLETPIRNNAEDGMEVV